MKSKIVASRDYKVMLRAAKFEQAAVPPEGLKAFWTCLRKKPLPVRFSAS